MDTNRLSGKKFIVIGRAGMDLNAPLDEIIEESASYHPTLGGSAANICVALSKQDMVSSIITGVSSDAIGQYVLHQLQKFNVNTQHVKHINGQARTSLAIVETKAEDQQCIIYRNNAADFAIDIKDVSDIDFTQFSGVIATGTALAAEPSRSATLRVLEMAKEHSVPTIIDLDYRPYSWASDKEATQTYSYAVELCDIVVGNDLEFGFLAGSPEKGIECARNLTKTTAHIAVYKMGPKGSYTFTKDSEFSTGIFPVTPIKPTGAGDAFLGGFLASLANGNPLKESVLRGSANASMVVTRFGCANAMPTQIELEQFIESHPGPTNN